MTQQSQQQQKIIKAKQGKVIKSQADKTIVVQIVVRIKHPYGKYIKRHLKRLAHDPENLCSVGDEVIIVEGRKVSARKSWHLKSIVNKAAGVK